MIATDADFVWFKNNLSVLFSKYGEKYLAIKNKQVLGSYDSYLDAVNITSKSEPVGSFIVQLCGPDESVYINKISSFNFML